MLPITKIINIRSLLLLVQSLFSYFFIRILLFIIQPSRKNVQVLYIIHFTLKP
nr:MAG TPA: hypothetical protein [Caudoviricetes sp.]